MHDRDKRALAAQFLGQAYLSAYFLMLHNKDAVEGIADKIIERKELYGNELLAILDDAKLEIPKVDLTDEAVWPKM
jgi:hypothetical protein